MANSFKTWVDSPVAGQQVQSATIFAADTQRKDGFKAGDPASALRINSSLRQANLVCASFMQFCDNNVALDIGLSLMSTITQVTSAITAVFTKLHADTLNSSKTYTNARETEITKTIAGVQSQVTGNANSITSLTTRMTTAEEEIIALSGGESSLTTRVTSLEARMTSVETAIAKINTPYEYNVKITDWNGTIGNYTYFIPATTHKRGKRPRAYTYVAKDATTVEETYDSSVINIMSGDVTIYSNTTIALLLVIY